MDESLLIVKRRPDFIVFPEYYNVNPALRDTLRNSGMAYRHLNYCKTLSDRFDAVVIAGSAIEVDRNRFYNTCSVFENGRLLGKYRKLHPTDNEQRHGIAPGRDPILLEIAGVRISIMICADVLAPDAFARLASLKPDIVFIPTTSPLKIEETVKDKFARDQAIFVDGARAAGSYLVKCCAVGRLWGGTLQGRSLAAAPWGILTRVTPNEENGKRILSVVLDIDELRDFRRKQETADAH